MSAQDLRFELDDGVNGGAQLQVVVPALGAAVATVRPEHMERATPCASWSMRDLLNHIVGGALMFADAFGGAPVRDISGRLPDVVGDDPSTAFGEAAARFGAALEEPGAMERVLDLPFGAMTVGTFLRFVAFDLTIHAWDVAAVTGATVEIPDELLGEIDAFSRLVLEAGPRSELLSGPSVAAPEGATALERLVAYSGREVPFRG